GTLSGSAGAGTLPKTIAVGGNYTCEFDGEFCATLGSHDSCTSGLEQVDKVTASLSDDNNEGNTVTVTSSTQLTVDVCFTSSTQSCNLSRSRPPAGDSQAPQTCDCLIEGPANLTGPFYLCDVSGSAATALSLKNGSQSRETRIVKRTPFRADVGLEPEYPNTL